jgi:hypothetical protein
MTMGLSSSSGFEKAAMLVGLEFKPPSLHFVLNFKSNLFA